MQVTQFNSEIISKFQFQFGDYRKTETLIRHNSWEKYLTHRNIDFM